MKALRHQADLRDQTTKHASTGEGPTSFDSEGHAIVFYASPLKSLVIFFLVTPLACYLGAFAFHMLQGATQKFVFTGVLALGIFALRMLLNCLRRRPVLLVDTIGIEDTRWPYDIIAWDDIVEVKTYGRNWDRVIIRVVDESFILSALPTLSRWQCRYRQMCGLPLFQIDFAGVHPNASRLFEFMQRHGLHSKM